MTGGSDSLPERSPLRARSIDETDRILIASATAYGVARIGSITRLDRIGIATATAVRRDPVGVSVSVCSGKGPTEIHARVSALGEALERHCAEPRGRVALRSARASEMEDPTIGPDELIASRWADTSQVIEWCRGERLEDGVSVWLPANAVLFPYSPRPPAVPIFNPHTHGLAAGASRTEAAVHGLLECIERDAYARAVALASTGRGADILVLAPEALGALASSYVMAIERADLRVLLRDLTCDSRIPVTLCTLTDGRRAHMGIAANPSAEGSVEGAIVEAAQSRLTDIQGAREDLPPRNGEPDPWFTQADGPTSRSLAESVSLQGLEHARTWLIARLRELGVSPIVTVDLSLDAVAMSVVRVIAPGLETWAHDPSRIGKRARQWLSRCEQSYS